LVLKFCPKCGSNLGEEKIACPECGIDLSNREENILYGEFPQRTFAWVIDINIIFFISFLLSLITYNQNFLFILNGYLFVLGFCYFWLLEFFNNGRTVGKLLLKLKTVDEKTFRKASLSKYAINNMLKSTYFIALDIIFGYIANLRTKDGKKRYRFTQTLSETVVISIKKKEE